MLDLPMDWNDLRFLVALSRSSSFAAAAKSLQVDQSTVSRRVASLERVVGFPVVVRGNRGFSWTAVGTMLVDAAFKVESAVHAVQYQVRTERQTPTGTVRVAMPSGMIAALAPWLSGNSVASGDVQFAFIGCAAPLEDIYAWADVVIRYHEPTDADLVSQVVFTEAFGLYAAKSFIQSAGMPQDSEAIKALPMVRCELSQIRALKEWLDFSRRWGTTDRVTVVDNLQSAEQLIGLGYGLGVLPVSQAAGNPHLLRLDHLAFASQPVYLTYHVSIKRSARIKAAVRRLRHALNNLVATYPSAQAS